MEKTDTIAAKYETVQCLATLFQVFLLKKSRKFFNPILHGVLGPPILHWWGGILSYKILKFIKSEI